MHVTFSCSSICTVQVSFLRASLSDVATEPTVLCNPQHQNIRLLAPTWRSQKFDRDDQKWQIFKYVTSTNVLWIRNWTGGRCCICARQTLRVQSTRGTQHFSALNGVMAAILKVWYHIRNPTPSIDAYLLEKQSCRISSRALFFFEERRPKKEKTEKIAVITRSVPDTSVYSYVNRVTWANYTSYGC